MPYQIARSLAEAGTALSRPGAPPLILAGGTDLMVRARERVAGEDVLDVAAGPEPQHIALDGARLLLGAGVTYTDCLTHPLVARGCPLLVRVAERFASPQIRNVATVGGNVANASPAGDGVAALWALDARVEALTPDGPVSRPIAEVVRGPGRLGLPDGSLLTGFRLPVAGPGEGAAFYRRVTGAWPEHPMAMSVASVAARLQLDAGGRVTLARVVLGAVAPTPVRAAEAERALLGQTPAPDRVVAAAAAVAAAARPIADVRGSAEHRREGGPAPPRAPPRAGGRPGRGGGPRRRAAS